MIRIGMLTDNMKETLAILSDEDVIEQLNEELPTPIICYGAEFYNERVTLKFGNERNPEKAIFLSSEDTDAIRKFCTIRLGRRDINIEKFHFMREGYVNSPLTNKTLFAYQFPLANTKNFGNIYGHGKEHIDKLIGLPLQKGQIKPALDRQHHIQNGEHCPAAKHGKQSTEHQRQRLCYFGQP